MKQRLHKVKDLKYELHSIKRKLRFYYFVPVFIWALQNLAINGATVSSCQFLGCTITHGIINIFDFDSHNFIGQAFNIYIAELA